MFAGESMKKLKDRLTTVIFSLIFLAGVSVMLYPTFSNWWNRHMASHAVADYKEAVTKMDDEEQQYMLEQAQEYNEKLYELYAPFSDFEQLDGYDKILDVSGTGIMGYVSIPNINIELPIYHGTSEGVLQIASGHIQGSSFPVGGLNTHAVISGHRGLPSARLFTDLDQIVEGDTFTINVLNDVLTYEVEKILIIEPTEIDKLAIIPNEDEVTLMTCTPYGINTHRLLIRAHRIKSVNDKRVKVSADAIQVDTMTVIPIFAAPMVLALLIWWSVTGKRKKHHYIDKYTIRELSGDDSREH